MNKQLIHPTAIVSPDAELGENVTVGPFSLIESNTVIGDGTSIHSHVNIRSGARIGRECQIHPGAVIAGIPQDLKFKGEETEAIIGTRTTIREYVTINRGTASRGKTVIGDNCLIMAYSHVAHDCLLGNGIITGNATQLAGEVEIDDYATLSGGVLVHQFVRISQHVMIQGGSKITKDVPPYTLVGREPVVFCGINIVGLRRRHYTDQQVFLINDVYRTFFQRGLNNSEAITTIEKEYPACEEVKLILDFVKSSERGIVRGNMD